MIRQIVFESHGDTVTATVGEQLIVETPRRSGRSRKVNDYLPPARRIDPARITRIEDRGGFYHVHYDPASGPSKWGNPFMVGKHDTIRTSNDA